MDVQIQYLGNSGFAVRMAERVWVFDYESGPDPLPWLMEAKEAAVFVSHRHRDHYSPEKIQAWRQAKQRLILVTSKEVPETQAVRLAPGERYAAYGMTVTAFDSTDMGVSFLVETEDITLFHAGDLNLWHWADESTDEEIAEAEKAFAKAVKPLLGVKMDIAFFPRDPRQGTGFDDGFKQFRRKIKPRHLIPMHFRDDRRGLDQLCDDLFTKVHVPQKIGDVFTLHI